MYDLFRINLTLYLYLFSLQSGMSTKPNFLHTNLRPMLQRVSEESLVFKRIEWIRFVFFTVIVVIII